MATSILAIPQKLRQFYEIKEFNKFIEEYAKLKMYNSSNVLNSITGTGGFGGSATSASASFGGSATSASASSVPWLDAETVLNKVKGICERLAGQVRDHCIKAITVPTYSYTDLYHYSHVILGLYDANTYYECLESSYASQLRNLMSEVQQLLEKYYTEIERVSGQAQQLEQKRSQQPDITIKDLYKQIGGTFLTSHVSLDALSVVVSQSFDSCLLEPHQLSSEGAVAGGGGRGRAGGRPSFIDFMDEIEDSNNKQASIAISQHRNSIKRSSVLVEENSVFEPSHHLRSSDLFAAAPSQIGSVLGSTYGDKVTQQQGIQEQGKSHHLIGYDKGIFKRFEGRWNVVQEADFDNFQMCSNKGFMQSPRGQRRGAQGGAVIRDTTVEVFYYLRSVLVQRLMDLLSKWVPCLIRYTSRAYILINVCMLDYFDV